MYTKEGDDATASTHSSLPWLSEQSSSWSDEDDETSSPLMVNTNIPNIPLHYASTSYTPSPLASSPTREPTKRPCVSDYELKNALDALVGSISAVINFLRTAGVPKPR
jgi:hypothetical protein